MKFELPAIFNFCSSSIKPFLSPFSVFSDDDASDHQMSVGSDCNNVSDRHSPLPIKIRSKRNNKSSGDKVEEREYHSFLVLIFLTSVALFLSRNLRVENLVLKAEIKRLVTLQHASHDQYGSIETVVQKDFTDANEMPVHIPKDPVEENHCEDKHFNSDDLSARYKHKKCDNIEDLKNGRDQQVESKNGADNGSQQFDNDDVTFVQKCRKIFDVATRMFLERQKKLGEEKEKDEKDSDDGMEESNGLKKQLKDMNAEWYDKMMKHREELVLVMGTEEPTSENLHTDQLNEREKIRVKDENTHSDVGLLMLLGVFVVLAALFLVLELIWVMKMAWDQLQSAYKSSSNLDC